jgi:hypothetical protein
MTPCPYLRERSTSNLGHGNRARHLTVRTAASPFALAPLSAATECGFSFHDQGNLISSNRFRGTKRITPKPTQSDLPKRMGTWKRRHRLDPAAQWPHRWYARSGAAAGAAAPEGSMIT